MFVKELRRDGKGVVHDITPAAIINTSERKVERIDDGGFEPVTYGTNDVRHPVSTLRLKEIFLIKNNDMPFFTLRQLAQRGAPYRHGVGVNTFHMADNVLDVHDIADVRETLLAKSIRSANFDHDYSLCSSTPNSFISAVDALNGAAAHLAGTESGKLTLKSVRMLGKAGESVLPPIKFGYDINAVKERATGYVSSSGIGDPDPVGGKRFSVSFSNAPGVAALEPGDIVKIFDNSNTPWFAVLISKSGGQTTFQTANQPPATGLVVTAIQKTKNPQYTKNAYDIWGFYKSDYVDFGHENISRMTSEISSKSTDAWSLRKIKTVTGAEINIAYESDTYKNSIKKISSVVIKDVVVHNESTGQVKVFFHGRNAGDIFKVHDTVKIHAVLRRDLVTLGGQVEKCDCDGGLNKVYFWATHATFNLSEVLEVGENFIVIEDNALVQQLLAPARDIWVDCSTFRETHVPTSGKRYHAPGGYLFTGGELQFSTNASAFSIGGGLRVKEVSVTNDFGVTNTIAYDYQQGTTSYEPLGLEVNINRIPGNDLRACMRDKETEALDEYRLNFTFKVAYRNMVHLLANARLMPGPGVMYGKVNVKEFTTKSGTTYQHPSNTTYSFEVFNPKLVDVFNKTLIVPGFTDNGYKLVTPFPTSNTKGTPAAAVQELSVADIQTSTASVQDFSAVVGTLRSIETFDAEGRKISETKNSYLFDELSAFDFAAYRADLNRFRNQGLVEEVFADAKLVKIGDTNAYLLLGLLSKFSQFPSIQISSTSTNYKTGLTQKTQNVAYDFYSGQVTRTLSSDAYGNYYEKESIPAYRKYPSLGLGMSGYKNMLSQSAGELVYKVHQEPGMQTIRDGLISGSVQTWSDELPVIRPWSTGTMLQPGIWRPLANYSFVGADGVGLLPDGSYPPAQVTTFNAWSSPDTAVPGWQKNSTVSLYDIYTHSLQGQDINGLYSAVKMSSNSAEVYATASNSQYGEFAFSGAEDVEINNRYGGGVARGDANEVLRQSITDDLVTHTGSKALRVFSPGIKAFSYSLTAAAGKAYHASVWVNAMGGRLYYKLNGVTTSTPAQPSEQRKAGQWYLVEIDIPAGNNNAPLEVWCETASGTCHFDDFRVHPVHASMVSYVYNKWGELSHVLDNNNLFTEFRYDAMGKLKETHKESFGHGVVKTSDYTYHYSSSSGN